MQEVRTIIESRKLPTLFSRKFGSLCYNLSVKYIHNADACQDDGATKMAALREAIFWSEQASLFFNGAILHAQHASAKSLSAKARISAGHFDDALQDLKFANTLCATPRSQMLELQCIVKMTR